MTTDNVLLRSTPEAQGIPPAALQAFVDAVERADLGLHSFMLLRHGQVIAEGWWAPYAPARPHMLFSLSKSFTSTAIGLAVAEGRLSVDDLVLSFFPEDAPAQPGANLRAMRVRHLLTMSTGHATDTTPHLHAAADGNWARAFLARPVEHEPGAPFVYNSGATYMLSAIMQKLTGTTVLDYLGPRLFAPLGIEGAAWQSCPRGINTGGWGLSIKTEDIARFGQMYLQDGVWRGQRIVPAEWIAAATAKQVANDGQNPDWHQGYGYQFWRCQHGAYRGDGAFGQFCVVMPEQDAVFAATSGSRDMQGILTQVWTHLLPAMRPVPLPDDRAAQAALAARLDGLALAMPQGRGSSPVAERVSGRVFTMEANDLKVTAASLAFDTSGCTFTLCDDRGKHRAVCGDDAWREDSTTLNPTGVQPTAGASAWTADDTYTIKLYLVETPFCLTITARFEADTLTLDVTPNVAFGPVGHPPLVGRA
jgi:CubicO group peptidase (beta-lactamase class C family)